MIVPIRNSLSVVLLLIVLHNAQAVPLGRLFFSADERAAMNALRATPKSAQMPAPLIERKPKLPPTSVVVPETPPEKRRAMQRAEVMTGFVERSSGKTTVWINNQPEQRQGGYGELDPLDVGKTKTKK